MGAYLQRAVALLVLTAAATPLFATELAPDTVLLRRGEATITYLDFRAMLARIPEEHRLSVTSDPERIVRLLESVAERRLLAREARAQERDADPLLAARLRIAADEILAQARLDRVAQESPPADYAQQAREYYLTHPDEFQSEERVHVCHVLIRAEQRSEAEAQAMAQEVLERARAGEPFGELVAEYSEDPSAARNEGCFTNVRRGQMVPPFEEAAFGLEEPGELAGPVQSRFGFHVLRLEEHHPAERRPFEAVREELVRRMRDEHEQGVKRQYVERLLRENPVRTDPEVMATLREQYVTADPEAGPDAGDGQ